MNPRLFGLWILVAVSAWTIEHHQPRACNQYEDQIKDEICKGFVNGAWNAACDELDDDEGRDGTSCRVAQHLVKTANAVFACNILNMITSCCACITPVLVICMPKPAAGSDTMSCSIGSLLVAVMVAGVFTIVLQIIVLVFAFQNEGVIKPIMEANCFNSGGAVILADIDTDLKMTRFLGIMELLLTVTEIIVAWKNGLEHAWTEYEKILEGAVGVLSVALSIVDFFWFSLDLRDKVNALFGTLQTGEYNKEYQVMPCFYGDNAAADSARPMLWLTLLLVAAVVHLKA